MTGRHRLDRYIKKRIVLLLLIVVAVFSYTVFTVYEWGVEDSVYYLMAARAEEASRSLNGTGRPGTTGGPMHVYPGMEALPAPVRALFPPSSHRHGELQVADAGDDYYYLLPYKRKDSDALFYVVHRYSEESDDLPYGFGVAELLLFLILCFFLLTQGLVMNLVWSVVRQVGKLKAWVSSLPSETAAGVSPPDLGFAEFDAVAGRVADQLLASGDLDVLA